MGGLAVLARQMGYEVCGSDQAIYPPMSEQLEVQGIHLCHGYDPAHLDPAPDLVVIGNALSRGNAAVEYVLDRGLAYTSGPAFLAEQVLRSRWVLAVAGTHGKTTTSSMLAWILTAAGLAPGYLIGGLAMNLPATAQLGDAPFFVVEADEYDSAFFDKRAKFIHYRPRTLVLNNLEYDHADIFPDLAAIERQFQHLLRTVPSNGLLIAPADDSRLAAVFAEGRWTPVEYWGSDSGGEGRWQARHISEDLQSFDVYLDDECLGRVQWSQMGRHNINNALAAIAAARHAGVLPAEAVTALSHFQGVRRRMEKLAVIREVSVYDDFAHHPTAIATTLEGLRQAAGNGRIIALLEPRSNTMKMGVHEAALPQSLQLADEVLLYQSPQLQFDLQTVATALGPHCRVFSQLEPMASAAVAGSRAGDHILIMSNGDFGNIHQQIIAILEAAA